jgi:hypothetical protein
MNTQNARRRPAMRRIEAPRAWTVPTSAGKIAGWADDRWRSGSAPDPVAVRVVRERDWRKLMELRRALHDLRSDKIAWSPVSGKPVWSNISKALDALEKEQR